MCELLGISSDRPADWPALLARFGQRGGATADNPDGWGLAYREEDAWHVRKAPEAAAGDTQFARLAQTITSDLLIAHVRKANPVTACVDVNTHPFARVCCGRQWVFAHNGRVPEIVQPGGCCHPQLSQPLGETDSEHAFCFLLDEIAGVFGGIASMKKSSWLPMLAQLSGTIAQHGQFNFLMSDGEHLIAYGHDRLHHAHYRGKRLSATVVASEPITVDAQWEAFLPGEMLVFRAGELLLDMQPRLDA